MAEVYSWRDAPKANFGVIGDPVSHSLSPRMHAAAYQALGLDYRYVAIHVKPGEVAQALEHLDGLAYEGVNVTVPHKEEVLLWADVVEQFAMRVRAANTVRLATREAINTDGNGFLDTLANLGLPVGARVLVLGAGGSARALLAALSGAGYGIGLWNRTLSKAQALLEELNVVAALHSDVDVREYSLVVNATSSGISGDALGIDWSKAGQTTIAYDLFYGDDMTPFLQSAAHFGLKCVDGRALLVEQGARSFEWWLDRQAPRTAMMNAIR